MNTLIKIPLVVFQNIIFGIHPTINRWIEDKILNPYYFGVNHDRYIKDIYSSFSKIVLPYTTIKNKTLLELGPGGTLGFGLLFLKNGGKEYFAVDYGDHRFKREITEVKNVKFFDISKTSHYPIPASGVDLIYSCAVLEHVADLDQCFNEMHRVLKRGGLMNHQVDLRDHIFNQQSLFFLYLPGWLLKLLFRNTGGYVNRFRFNQYLELFDRYN